MAQTMLDHRSDPLFDGMREPLREFVQLLKSRSARPANQIPPMAASGQAGPRA